MKSACCLLVFALSLHAGKRCAPASFTIHMILHAIGEEKYEITPSDGGLTLNTTIQYSDRGMQRSTTAVLRTAADLTPLAFEVKGRPSSVKVEGATVTVAEDAATRSFAAPGTLISSPSSDRLLLRCR